MEGPSHNGIKRYIGQQADGANVHVDALSESTLFNARA